MEIQHFYDTIIEIKHDIMIVSGIINIRSAESEESLSGAREDSGDRTYQKGRSYFITYLYINQE
ncbi:hypothetical protein TXYLGN1_11470 [Tepidimicrobium xylanilyticum]